MAISRVDGTMLQNNLQRDGVNLAIETDLVYLDVTNDRMGIRTSTPRGPLDVVGNVMVGNIVISNIGNVSLGNVNINNLATPVSSTDASTKGYSDGLFGNITINNVTISASTSNANILIDPPGTGQVKIVGTNGLVIPIGNTVQRPSIPEQGILRFNSETNQLEIYDGGQWDIASGDTSAITNQTITPDGILDTFTLDQSTSAASILVSLNGLQQTPVIDYLVSGDQLTFTTVPLSSDIVQVRFIAATTTTTKITNDYDTTSISVTNTPEIIFTINNIDIARFDQNNILNLTASHSLQLPSYTLIQANALTNVSIGQVVYVSNGDSGNPCIAVYSSGAWKRIALGSTISS